MLKIDMDKVYNQVNWHFLLEVLRRLGFSDKWQNLILNAMSSPYYLVMLNGCTKGFFKASHGL